jgi:predicted secreted acid phosphatase
MTLRKLLLLVCVCCWSMKGQQPIVTVVGEPPNLNDAKQHLKDYYNCTGTVSGEDCYLPQLKRQTDQAMKFLQESVATARPGEKLALVLDIDETALSNWAVEMHDDFGYIPADSNWLISLHGCTAIAGTLQLFHEAEKDKVAVFFITGRPESQRDDTAANLKAVGYDHWEWLSLRPDVHPKGELVEVYKSAQRADIVAKGYRLILNVGDQISDLKDPPMAEHSVKLPNPFYYIP